MPATGCHRRKSFPATISGHHPTAATSGRLLRPDSGHRHFLSTTCQRRPTVTATPPPLPHLHQRHHQHRRHNITIASNPTPRTIATTTALLLGQPKGAAAATLGYVWWAAAAIRERLAVRQPWGAIGLCFHRIRVRLAVRQPWGAVGLWINTTKDIDVSMDIEDDYHDSEGDIIYLESLLNNDTIPYLPPDVFLDHNPRSLKDEPDNDLKSMVKVFDPGIWEKKFSPTYVRLPFEDRHYFSLTFVIRIFLPCLTYSMDSSLLISSGSEDTIFDPGISVFSCYSLEPVVSHRSGTFILDPFVEIPSGESKVHIEVLSVLWGNRLPIPDGSLPLSRYEENYIGMRGTSALVDRISSSKPKDNYTLRSGAVIGGIPERMKMPLPLGDYKYRRMGIRLLC
ncbi:hypothetical protein Tco_0500309 [Tanacetum coccineum]